MSETSLAERVARETLSFSPESAESVNALVDRLAGALGRRVELLGMGEPMHGDEGILRLRNRVFKQLVESHGFTAIAIESSYPRCRVVNDYVNHRGAATGYDAVSETGFSHGFGRSPANRELVEWMRAYNADPAHARKLQFYGFDAPTEMTHSDSPRQLLSFALDYLASIDPTRAGQLRDRIVPLIGDDAAWENTAANFDASKSIGLSPAAKSLRLETENLLTELRCRRPELVGASDVARYEQAIRDACGARDLLTYHGGVAGESPTRIADLLGLRDVMMGDNLVYMVRREQRRAGKVFAFAHNSHLQRSRARWQLGPHALAWWPAGAQVDQVLGEGYAVIGMGIVSRAEQGIARAEEGTVEAMLAAGDGPGRLVATGRLAVAGLTSRSGSAGNPTYFPLTGESLGDFDWVMTLGDG
jgi:erythromycin esterase-like protein